MGLWLVSGATFLASAARGDEPPKTPLPGPVLKLRDGGIVPGMLADSGRSGAVCWKSGSFETPFDFPLNEGQSIRFPGEGKSPLATGTFGFELTGGDLLHGSIANLDDKVVEIDVPNLRRLRVDRTRVRRIFRWRDGAGLVYKGPNGLVGWREFEAPNPQPKRGARMPAVVNPIVRFDGRNFNEPREAKPNPGDVPAGPGWVEDGESLETTREKAAIQGDVGLSSRAAIELEISWKREPNFSVALAVSDDERSVDRAFRLEVWDGKLVALRETAQEADLASIQPVPGGPGRTRLQLFLDQEVGRLLVFSENGESLADLKLGGPASPSLRGIRLTNIRGDLRLERLWVGRWDGETPRPLMANESRVQLTDQSTLRGEVDQFDATSREFVVRGDAGLSRVAEGRVETIHLVCPEDDARRTVQVAYADGTRLGGRWIGVEAGRMFLTVPGIADPIRLPEEGLRSLDVVERDEEKTRTKDETVGTLDMDGIRVMGRLVNSTGRPGEGSLAWRPLASEMASVIRAGASGRIIYQTPAP